MSAGIDYGMGQSNVDHATGIRYGVIAQGNVGQAWYDSAEPDYGEPTCPKCGNAAKDHDSFEGDTDDYESGHGCSDFVCEPCRYVFDSQDAFGDEPVGWHVDEPGYELGTCLDVNIFVLKSPFYTLARFCSPCVPGAGDLDNPDDGGIKTYCLGHDWFESDKAPYPVFRVDTGEEVQP